jgi:hypothetical protein
MRAVCKYQGKNSLRKHLPNGEKGAYFLLGRKPIKSTRGENMKRLIVFMVLCSFLWILWTFLILCPSTNAQWEGAEVQRLTYNDVPEISQEMKLYIDGNDNLHLFYLEGIRDSATGFIYSYRLMSTTKEKGAGWSQPQEIGDPAGMGWGDMEVGYDIKTGTAHIVYARFLSLDYDTMYYTNSEMSNWELIKIDSLSNEHNARYESVAMEFDSLGNVHLVWNVDFDSTASSWYRLMYANNSTGEWVKQQVSPPIFLGGMGSGPTYLAVQKNGTGHIVYYGDVDSVLSCYVRNDSLNSQNWHLDTIPKPSRPFLYYGAGPIKVDVNDRVHLITGGCIEHCTDPGHSRSFYYYKQAEDSIWIGPDLILDSLSAVAEIFIDSESDPYLLEWDPFTYCWFFTDRRQGFWQEPYQIFDTTSMCNAPSSIYVRSPSFVLDSEGTGHSVFTGYVRQFLGHDDSLEIYYYGLPFTSVEDTLEEQRDFRSELFQNYPNPFNSVTSIRYTVASGKNRPIHTTLKIYNILGKEVRELVNTSQSTGSYSISWDGKNNEGKEVASGIYFYQLQAGDYKETKKLVLMK